jgi:hypothetical protein
LDDIGKEWRGGDSNPDRPAYETGMFPLQHRAPSSADGIRTRILLIESQVTVPFVYCAWNI